MGFCEFCIGSDELFLNVLFHDHAFCQSPFLMYTLKSRLRLAAIAIAILSLHACAVIAVADAAVTVVATGVKVTTKVVGSVAEAVIP